jgi:beta-glucosidase
MSELDVPRFPEDFVWGVSSAAYQMEGAVTQDGRGESIWDRFCAAPGRGKVSEKGLGFYDRLADALLEAGIKPVAVLYHWDLPQVLEDEGGWAARDTVEAFAEYSRVVAMHLGDRVTQWVTQLEPWVTAWLGYGFGVHAPGRRSEADAVAASHHAEGLLRLGAHGQLRVELGLLEALRARPRRLPEPEADAEGELLLVPRLHRVTAALQPVVPVPGRQTRRTRRHLNPRGYRV